MSKKEKKPLFFKDSANASGTKKSPMMQEL
jgi:hypothetical protein